MTVPVVWKESAARQVKWLAWLVVPEQVAMLMELESLAAYRRVRRLMPASSMPDQRLAIQKSKMGSRMCKGY